MFYLFMHIVLFWKCSGFEISERRVTWDDTDSECSTYLPSISFSPDVKDKLSMSLPSNEKLWIRTASTPMSFSIWKGCFKRKTYMRGLKFTKLENDSITNCFIKSGCQHRDTSSIALKGDMCACVFHETILESHFTQTGQIPDYCFRENLNEECVCPADTYSLYKLRDLGDDDLLCVALHRDADGKLHFSKNDCLSKYRTICETSNGFRIWTVLVPTAVVLCCVLIAVIVVIKWRNFKKKRAKCVNNRFYDQVVCSTMKAKKEGQAGGSKESNPQESDNIYHTIYIDEEFVTPSNDGVYDVTFSHSNKVLPKSDNVYAKCNYNAKEASNSLTNNRENKDSRTISLQTRAKTCRDRNQYETIFLQDSL